jgi:hypothetical protein
MMYSSLEIDASRSKFSLSSPELDLSLSLKILQILMKERKRGCLLNLTDSMRGVEGFPNPRV